MTTLAEIGEAIAAAGLVMRGALQLAPDERSGELAACHSLVLVGIVGRRGWDVFARSPEAADGLADPLDRWSRRCLGELAAATGATPLYPFGGPPHWPFQRWAQRAEPLHPSPLGLLIHPGHGLWHSYRGALAFPQDLGAQPPPPAASPCASCTDRPCLSACPVGAFTAQGYAADLCAAWLRGAEGRDCMARGCQARRACPVAPDQAHAPDQAAFGMKAYLAAR